MRTKSHTKSVFKLYLMDCNCLLLWTEGGCQSVGPRGRSSRGPSDWHPPEVQIGDRHSPICQYSHLRRSGQPQNAKIEQIRDHLPWESPLLCNTQYTRNLIIWIFAFWSYPGLWGHHSSLCEHFQRLGQSQKLKIVQKSRETSIKMDRNTGFTYVHFTGLTFYL